MIDFDVIINKTFAEICTNERLTPIERKRVLSLVNDFEDGIWRHGKFQNFIWDNVAETALSHGEREALIDRPHSQLTQSAKKLRLTDNESDVSRGSEISEIVLYGIMKHHYGALPVVPKIFYKQNPNDNAKGADSVHILIDDNQGFTIWFGEAKFYNSIEDPRLGEIIRSVENALKTDKIKKEKSIVTDLTDLQLLIENQQTLNEIRQALASHESIDHLKPRLHVPILVLYECEMTNGAERLDSEYISELESFHIERVNSYFKKQIERLSSSVHLYDQITFHIILFPIPVKKDVVNQFIATANALKNT